MHSGYKLLPCLLVVLAGCALTPRVDDSDDAETAKLKSLTPGSTQDILQCGSGHAVGRTIKYIPQPEVPVFNYSIVKFDDNNEISLDHKEFAGKDSKGRNELLPNISSEVAVEELDGAIEVGGFLSGSAERRKITIDFMKYRTEPVLVGDPQQGQDPDQSEDQGQEQTMGQAQSRNANLDDEAGVPSPSEAKKIAYYSRVGVGLRVEIDISTVDTQASLGSLVAIAASARAGRSAGTLSTRIVGMESPEITALSPFTSDLSEGSIQQVLNGLASVRAKLHESDTNVHPHFLARIACVPVKD